MFGIIFSFNKLTLGTEKMPSLQIRSDNIRKSLKECAILQLLMPITLIGAYVAAYGVSTALSG